MRSQTNTSTSNVPGTAVPAVDAVLALAALATWAVFSKTQILAYGLYGPPRQAGQARGVRLNNFCANLCEILCLHYSRLSDHNILS